MTTVASKRELSDGISVPTKRQQNNENEAVKGPLASLVSIIPERPCKFEIFSKTRDVTVGRSRSCDVRLNEPDISTVHAILSIIDMEVDGTTRHLINIIDKSRNGTFINGNRLIKKDYLLKNGDKIMFGKSCSFLFKYNSEFIKVIEPISLSQQANTDDSVFKKPSSAFTSSQNAARKLAKLKVISFFDRYTLGRELGSGHYAIVKEGKNKQTGQTVAIKIFHPQQNDDQKKSKQFREETNILMRIHHPNIVNLLDSFVEPISKQQTQKYLVLEKIDNGELFDRIVKKTCLRQDETKAIFTQILHGLKYLHGQNIIHRDIKPENILLNITKRASPDQKQLGPWDDDEIDVQVKIADFGLAKFTGEMQFTNTLCGTPSYVAPEVLIKKGYTSKVDMWSSGVILYVCLCGFPPFSDQLGPPALKEQILQAKFAFYTPYWDNIDDSILHLISHLLVLDPEQRYSVADAFSHPWLVDTEQVVLPTTELKRLQLSDNKLIKTYSELASSS